MPCVYKGDRKESGGVKLRVVSETNSVGAVMASQCCKNKFIITLEVIKCYYYSGHSPSLGPRVSVLSCRFSDNIFHTQGDLS